MGIQKATMNDIWHKANMFSTLQQIMQGKNTVCFMDEQALKSSAERLGNNWPCYRTQDTPHESWMRGRMAKPMQVFNQPTTFSVMSWGYGQTGASPGTVTTSSSERWLWDPTRTLYASPSFKPLSTWDCDPDTSSFCQSSVPEEVPVRGTGQTQTLWCCK